MGERMTREQFLEKIFNKSYDELKGKKLRLTRLNVPAREINFAHVIGVARTEIYQNLSLHIGTHAGEDHTGESIGLLHVVPNEATIVAADVAMKSGNVTIGFLDRYSNRPRRFAERTQRNRRRSGLLQIPAAFYGM